MNPTILTYLAESRMLDHELRWARRRAPVRGAAAEERGGRPRRAPWARLARLLSGGTPAPQAG